jgi:hypothetical protein
MVRPRTLLAGTVAILGSLYGCGSGPFSAGDERALAEAQARWAAAGLVDYRVEVRTICFCVSALPVFTALDVRDGVVITAVPLESGHDDNIPLTAWPTVAEAFDVIERAAQNDAVYTEVEVEYDAEMGYPRSVDLTCRPDILDCGLTYELRNLEPLPTEGVARP